MLSRMRIARIIVQGGDVKKYIFHDMSQRPNFLFSKKTSTQDNFIKTFHGIFEMYLASNITRSTYY